MKSSIVMFSDSADEVRHPWWLAWLPASIRARIGGRQNLLAVLANSGWLLFDKLIRALLGLAVGAWVARYLGPTQFGMLAYVVAFVALFQAVANLGADAIVVRDIAAQDKHAAHEILGTALALRLASGTLCWLGVVACVAIFNADAPRTILMAAIVGGVLVFQATDTVDLWFQSQSQSRRTVVAKLCAYLLSSGVKVALILAKAPLEAFAVVTAFDALACAASLAVAYRILPTAERWIFKRSRARHLLAECWPFMLSGLAIMVYARIDQIMVKEMLGDRALGIYASALPLSQFWLVIPITLVTSLAPLIAKKKLAEPQAYRRALVLTFRAFFYMGVGSVVVTWFLAGPLIEHLFGSAYSEAVTVLNAHAISNIFSFLGMAHSLWLTNERRFAVRLYGTVLAGIVSLGVNFVLLPRVGTVGAAYAAICAQVVAAFLINFFLDRRSFQMQCEAIFFRKV